MKTTLIIACGAIAQELTDVLSANQWTHVDITCLPAKWHNTPEKIAPAIEVKIAENRDKYQHILIGYADCGSGGKLEAIAKREGVEMLPGAHCYAFFSGARRFEDFVDDELGTFYLTDYLAANFDRLILQDLGILKHPELADMYFGNYKKILYLSQREDQRLIEKAQNAAASLNLAFEHIHTGLQPFDSALRDIKIVAQ